MFLKLSLDDADLHQTNSFKENAAALGLIFAVAFGHPLWMSIMTIFWIAYSTVFLFIKRTTDTFKNEHDIKYRHMEFHFDRLKDFQSFIDACDFKQVKDINLGVYWHIIYLSDQQKKILGKKMDDLSFEKEVLE